LEAENSEAGGQGSKALSRPIREDSPAARITPAKLGARDMLGKIAERNDNVSAWNQRWVALPSQSSQARYAPPAVL
jgi:hypothetical protein